MHRLRHIDLPAMLDRGQRLRQRVEPTASRPKIVAVLFIIALEPARAQTKDEPTVADMIDCFGHVGE